MVREGSLRCLVTVRALLLSKGSGISSRAAKEDAPMSAPRGQLLPCCTCPALPCLMACMLSGCRHYPSKAGHVLMDSWYDSPVPSYSPTSRMVPREHGKSFQTGKQWPLSDRTGSLGWFGVLGEGSCGPDSSTEAMLDFPGGQWGSRGVPMGTSHSITASWLRRFL